MTQKDKQLLLKDLSARIPFGVKVQYTAGDGTCIDCDIDYVSARSQCVAISDSVEKPFVWRSIENIKPYLRTLSSMTREEARKYVNCGNITAFSSQKDHLIPNPNSTDWLNAHHFDYRGLIEKNLALDCTGLHIYD